MSRTRRLALAATAGLVFALAAPSAAQQTVKREPIKPMADVSGAANFREYCTVCHGTGGRGDGPAAKALTKAPADLTGIAKRNGGKFPALAVRMTIVGDTEYAAHGSREMPMWGHVFRSVDGDPTTALRLRNLVNYLESIQEK
jgi:mono/diheme cytochrome c family protein